MVCTHLKDLYQLCETHDLRLGGSDLIRIICRQCEQEETCPSVLMEEYDSRHSEEDGNSANADAPAHRD
ncbi:MAG: hypothetical protein R3C19_10495 [Planctomycetaceae bacterium]